MDIHIILRIICLLCSIALLIISIYELITVTGGKILAKFVEKMVIRALKEEGKEPTTENVEAYIDKILEEIKKEDENKANPNPWIDEDIDE